MIRQHAGATRYQAMGWNIQPACKGYRNGAQVNLRLRMLMPEHDGNLVAVWCGRPDSMPPIMVAPDNRRNVFQERSLARFARKGHCCGAKIPA
jgi:hypothetical protein